MPATHIAQPARIEDLPAAERTAELGETLAAVWERSVRATHQFLTEDDIMDMRPFVGEAVRGIGQLAVAFGEDGQPLGFAGVETGKLEMLFIDSAARGKGVGRALLAHAVDAFDAHRLDVNEQNPQAVGFYEHEGWHAVYRSSRDDAGRPFPYIRMQRESGIRAEMASGDWYESTDPALAADRLRARRLMRAYDDAYYANEGGADILHSALGAFGFASELTAGARGLRVQRVRGRPLLLQLRLHVLGRRAHRLRRRRHGGAAVLVRHADPPAAPGRPRHAARRARP